MKKKKLLFVCIHNSARSQMAEAFLNRIGAGQFEAESAGLEPGELNPLVVEVMREVGIDLSGNQTKSLANFMARMEAFDFVVTVCDEASAERCPVFPAATVRLHWSFADPSGFQGTRSERLAQTRAVRDLIEKNITQWCDEFSSAMPP